MCDYAGIRAESSRNTTASLQNVLFLQLTTNITLNIVLSSKVLCMAGDVSSILVIQVARDRGAVI